MKHYSYYSGRCIEEMTDNQIDAEVRAVASAMTWAFRVFIAIPVIGVLTALVRTLRTLP